MEQKLKSLMSKVFGIQENSINDETSMNNVARWDSLQHMQLMVAIENQFNIALEPDDYIVMINYAAIRNILRKKGVQE